MSFSFLSFTPFAPFIFFLAFALFTPFAHGTDISLYDRMIDITRRELQLNVHDDRSVEMHILPFVSAELPYISDAADVTKIQMDNLLRGGNDLCEAKKLNPVSQCPAVRATAESLVDIEESVLSNERDLQLIASSFEEPILGGFSLPFTSRMQGIARMWRADTGNAGDTATDGAHMRISTEEVPENANIGGTVKALGAELEKLIVTSPDTSGVSSTDNSGADANLDSEDISELSAAVWKYRFAGIRWIQGRRPLLPQPSAAYLAEAPGTEREMLQGHWPDMEKELASIADTLIAEGGQFNLTEGEVVQFTFPADMNDMLPDNVRIWAYIERMPGGAIDGDAGLEWAHALEPAPLTLCGSPGTGVDSSEESAGRGIGGCLPVLGGHYPPPPPIPTAEDSVAAIDPDTGEPDGSQPPTNHPMCLYPLMRGGMLCLPEGSDGNGGKNNICSETAASIPDGVVLAACTGPEQMRETEAGGDVCAAASWQQSGEGDTFDPNTQCKVAISCGDNAFDATTLKKNDEGIIPIVMKSRPGGSPVPLFLHELTHAKQACNIAPGYNPYEQAHTQQERVDVCCGMEGDAYRVQCQAMAQNGEFTDKYVMTDGTPLNEETCTQILTDASCRQRTIHDAGGDKSPDAGACPWSYTFHQTYDETFPLMLELISHEEDWLHTHNQDVDDREASGELSSAEAKTERMPETCEDIMNATSQFHGDPRVDAMVQELEHSGHDVCTPLAQTTFRNTIGNTMCFLNRCWQQSFAEHRLVPGRTPMTAGDGAFPFDVCMRDDPQLGRVIPGPSPDSEWVPAPYRPAMLLKHMEETLCPGMPLGSPLCSFDPQRRLVLPLNNGEQYVSDFANQEQEFQRPGLALRQLGEAVGIRIGTDLWNDLLKSKTRALTDFTTIAASLLSQFPKVTFPTAVCPIGFSAADLTNSPYCGTNGMGAAADSSSVTPESASGIQENPLPTAVSPDTDGIPLNPTGITGPGPEVDLNSN